ncbi:MAG TPA: FAD-dependent monooxygenase [Pyrinomonadaceae bacterium]|jgi:2-polyprenyl-6-methoxyphenol hydroxylase-like FAD-dependent oxidoreductase|nr:FAD-dependent monooxygenase [Pyrinomonadaceae bacterium]
MKTDVIIVGAGPTGLALACQLIRCGIDFVIFDRKETTTPFSKAIGVQARTLEIYEQIGLADDLIALGAIAEKARMIVGGKVRGEINFTEFGKGMSAYPYVLIVEQGRHEKLLYDFIKSNGKDIRWQTELETFSQNEAGVTANIKTAGGAAETIEAKFLVGCDGAKSPVRHGLGLTFEGSTFERIFYVADVQIDWKFDHDALMVFLMKNNLLAFFPMIGENRWRIVGTFPEEFAKDEGEILYEEIEAQIKKDSEVELDITKVSWFSTYKVHTRHVSKFSEGRCFLAGDAAHIHTPAGAQGMNTGIQDGYNLAWKLAAVLGGKSNLGLLETYNQERLPNAESLLKTTDRFFNLVASPEPVLSYVRTHIFPYVAGAAFSIDAVKKFIFPRISQIGINYRHSSLSASNGSFAVKAGDRMPYFEVENASIYDRLHAPKFHLLRFFDGENKPPEFAGDDLTDVHEIPLYPNIAEIFGADKTFSVLLRPDNYIGLITEDASGEDLKQYLSRFGA